MADPNAHRDAALKDIARELASIGRTLEKIERNTRPSSTKPRVEITNGSANHPPDLSEAILVERAKDTLRRAGVFRDPNE